MKGEKVAGERGGKRRPNLLKIKWGHRGWPYSHNFWKKHTNRGREKALPHGRADGHSPEKNGHGRGRNVLPRGGIKEKKSQRNQCC